MATASPSRLTYAPILLGVAFIATLFMVAESGYKRLHEAGLAISAAEERQALVSRYLRLVLDAESAQRGFLVAEDPRFLSLAQEVLPEGEGFRAVTHIPVAIVERVQRLTPRGA